LKIFFCKNFKQFYP